MFYQSAVGPGGKSLWEVAFSPAFSRLPLRSGTPFLAAQSCPSTQGNLLTLVFKNKKNDHWGIFVFWHLQALSEFNYFSLWISFQRIFLSFAMWDVLILCGGLFFGGEVGRVGVRLRGIKGRLYQAKKYGVHTQRDLKISLNSVVCRPFHFLSLRITH